MKLKFIEEKIMRGVMLAMTVSVVIFVVNILYTIVRNGCRAMSWEMLTALPGGGFYIGQEGGLLNAIVGSFYIVGASALLGLLVSIPVVFFLNVYLSRTSGWAAGIRLAYDVLFGIPSIVYGAFAFTVMVALGLKTSLAGGILVITILIIPIFIRSMDEIAHEMPRDILNASYSLGATRLETIKVLLRQIAPGIATATLLSIGRAVGDAAAVLFTAGYTDNIPTSLSQPAATLPLAVFFQLNSPIPAVQERAYAAALILTAGILLLSLLGRWITAYFSKNRIH